MSDNPHAPEPDDDPGRPGDPEPGPGARPEPVVEIVDDVEHRPERDGGEADGERPGRPERAVTEPGKLMRIALMLREMQEEVRQAPIDEAGRARLRTVHEQALGQMHSVLSPDLRDELTTLALPFEGDVTPSESEVRIAQAQLIGWLEGLFQGIQAAIFNQQAQARQQLEQMRPRGLGPGDEGSGQVRRGTGQYL